MTSSVMTRKSATMRAFEKLLEIIHCPIGRVDRVVVGDVIAIVTQR